eukprot:scaffold2608_cov245-Pinguiococcus_pyrenoidosus.AAC.4
MTPIKPHMVVSMSWRCVGLNNFLFFCDLVALEAPRGNVVVSVKARQARALELKYRNALRTE